MSVKKSSRKCVALPKLLFCLLNLKHEPRKISVELENTPRVLSLFYFSTWSFGNHKLTLSVKFTTLKKHTLEISSILLVSYAIVAY